MGREEVKLRLGQMFVIASKVVCGGVEEVDIDLRPQARK